MEFIVSAIIITYKQGKYLSDAIEGALMQELSYPYEVIISNDKSPDNTDEVVRHFIETHPKGNIIRYFRHEKNLGMMGNFAFALQSCKGKYIGICEGDDYWTDPLKLSKQVEAMEQNPDVVITYHDARKVDANGIVIAESMLPEERKRDFTSDELKTGIWVLTQSMCVRNIMKDYPKSFYKVYNGDTFFTSLIGNFGKGKYVHGINPACYRVHEAGIWSMKSEAERNIRSIYTPAELMLFYKEKGDTIFYEIFREKTCRAFVSTIEHTLPFTYKIKLLGLILHYSKFLGIKNTLYYLKRTFIL